MRKEFPRRESLLDSHLNLPVDTAQGRECRGAAGFPGRGLCPGFREGSESQVCVRCAPHGDTQVRLA